MMQVQQPLIEDNNSGEDKGNDGEDVPIDKVDQDVVDNDNDDGQESPMVIDEQPNPVNNDDVDES